MRTSINTVEVTLEFEAAKSFDFLSALWLDLAAGAAWCDDYELNAEVDGSNMDGFNHWYISACIAIRTQRGCTTDPYIKYVGCE